VSKKLERRCHEITEGIMKATVWGNYENSQKISMRIATFEAKTSKT
jgi:hypothetical protein